MTYLPRITVVTVIQNDPEGLETTINSVSSQSYQNIEYIIIDGKSESDTISVIKKYLSNISYWKSEPDLGLYDAMNKGLKAASGEWVNFMNAGDVFDNSEVLSNIFHNNDYQKYEVIYGKTRLVLQFGSVVKGVKPLNNLWKGMSFSHQSMFIKHDIHLKYKFNLKYNFASDFDLIFRMYKNKIKFVQINNIVSRVKANGITESNIVSSIKERWQIIHSTDNSLYHKSYYIFILVKNYIKKFIPIIMLDYYYKKRYSKHYMIDMSSK